MMANDKEGKMADAAEASRHRPVRSFVLRAGRMTAAQRRAMEELWPLFGIDFAGAPLNVGQLFATKAPLTLEIGFGNGDCLAAMAAAAPENNFIGIEVHEPGVGHCLLRIAEEGLNNVRLIRHDAVEVLQNSIPDDSLTRVNLFFPDPWHKKRHNKRRIVQPDFVRLLSRKLRANGVFHVATDWPDYAGHIADVMNSSAEFELLPDTPNDRPVTRFDTRGKKLGHENWERAWCRCSKLPIAS
jgi:tRNA (guanine-N7-)-methyltransferase